MPRSNLPTPSLGELHADDIRRGAIRINDERWKGRYCVLLPDREVVGRWITIDSFTSKAQAAAFAAGYCARRDEVSS